MFPADPDERHASTSATAWTTFALHRHLQENLVPPDLKDRVEKAVRSGVEWLKRRVRVGEARWEEYPPEQTHERQDYVAVSALVMHVIRKIDGTGSFDGLWLNKLPFVVPGVRDSESAKGFIEHEGTFMVDQVRHYRYPWMLRTTAEAYRAGNVWQKAGAFLWLEEALKQPLVLADFRSGKTYEDWTMAEVLYALRDVADTLKVPLTSAAPPVAAGTIAN
jgi:hypothetical protein